MRSLPTGCLPQVTVHADVVYDCNGNPYYIGCAVVEGEPISWAVNPFPTDCHSEPPK